MTTFDKREDGFEKKFAVDEELKFKAVARRNKLLGQLIAEKLGMSGEAACLRQGGGCRRVRGRRRRAPQGAGRYQG